MSTKQFCVHLLLIEISFVRLNFSFLLLLCKMILKWTEWFSFSKFWSIVAVKDRSIEYAQWYHRWFNIHLMHHQPILGNLAANTLWMNKQWKLYDIALDVVVYYRRQVLFNLITYCSHSSLDYRLIVCDLYFVVVRCVELSLSVVGCNNLNISVSSIRKPKSKQYSREL